MGHESLFSTGYADARLLAQLGITRVGDITGLDSIGIPVWFACRPNSRALSVSQGKGATDAQARISAVMEAAEGAVAERPEDIAVCFGTAREMADKGRRTVPLDRLMRCNLDRFRPDHRYAWARGFGVKSGQEVFIPYELVGLDLRAETPWDHAAFQMSSIGLGAGRERPAAMAHALLEVVEHDATASLDLFGLSDLVARGVPYVAGTHAELDRLVELVRAAGFEPRFFDITGRTPLPVVACFFERIVASEDGVGATLTAGFACRPDAYSAACAALLECVQSRATDIAGSRDDIKDADYRGSRAKMPARSTSQIDFGEIKGHTALAGRQTAQDRCDHVAKIVLESGIDEIYCFPLADPALGIEVVRIVVPGLGVSSESNVTQGSANLIAALLGAL